MSATALRVKLNALLTVFEADLCSRRVQLALNSEPGAALQFRHAFLSALTNHRCHVPIG
jgi:hypothetical protein